MEYPMRASDAAACAGWIAAAMKLGPEAAAALGAAAAGAPASCTLWRLAGPLPVHFHPIAEGEGFALIESAEGDPIGAVRIGPLVTVLDNLARLASADAAALTLAVTE
jgi:hypothetical protein